MRKDKIAHAEYVREWRAKQPEHEREKRRFLRYSIRKGQYAEILVQQNGRCAICKKVPEKEALCVDHDHTTGKIRGLLCHNCNRGIGQLKDDPILVAAALEYLLHAKSD